MIQRTDREIVFGICWKPTKVDPAIKMNSCLSEECKKADFKYLLNRLDFLRNDKARRNNN
jgi:hypothetical protein